MDGGNRTSETVDLQLGADHGYVLRTVVTAQRCCESGDDRVAAR